MRTKNLLILFALLILAACSDKEDPLEDLFLELDASSENVDYGDAFTLTWQSNASQCYAGGRWFGEKPTSGSEEIEIKRGGISTFIMDCRRNNDFINQAVAVTIVKSTVDHFVFTERAEEPDFVVEYTENEKVKTSERLNELNLLLSRLTEKLDDEKNIKHSIDELNMNVKNIIENDKIHSNELINNINLELRALSKVIEKLNK